MFATLGPARVPSASLPRKASVCLDSSRKGKLTDTNSKRMLQTFLVSHSGFYSVFHWTLKTIKVSISPECKYKIWSISSYLNKNLIFRFIENPLPTNIVITKQYKWFWEAEEWAREPQDTLKWERATEVNYKKPKKDQACLPNPSSGSVRCTSWADRADRLRCDSWKRFMPSGVLEAPGPPGWRMMMGQQPAGFSIQARLHHTLKP